MIRTLQQYFKFANAGVKMVPTVLNTSIPGIVDETMNLTAKGRAPLGKR
jgi:hypothetical protein